MYDPKEFFKYDSFGYVEKIYEDYLKDIEYFNKTVLNTYTEAFSLFTNYQTYFSNIFLVSCANSFEQYFENEFPKIFSFNKESIHYNFLINYALKRKYFQLFDWDNNANSFFGKFGKDFLALMKIFRDENPAFKEREKEFLLLGKDRNKLVHNGMRNQVLVIDISTIYERFKKSQFFCDQVLSKLSESLA